jgi:HlyD family secretion protein
LTAINLDDDLTIQESVWRGRIISLFIVAALVAVAGAAAWWFYFRDTSSSVARATEEIPVKRSTINQTVLVSGTADAQFNSNLIFESTGKVKTVAVKVGDIVKQGDVLASLESDEAQNAVASAQANQGAAQLRLDDLVRGSTASELAAAEQLLAAAQAGLTKAENDYDTLVAGGTPADLAAAQQAVNAAEAQLATAQSSRDKLNTTPSAADKAAAEAGVAAAESALTAAQNSAASAENTVISVSATLKSAEHGYCGTDAAPAFCTTQSTPISAADAALMQTALSGPACAPAPAACLATLASSVIGANGAYLNAVNGAEAADAAVSSAEDSLTSAKARLAAVKDGPTSADTAAADAAVTAAESSVAAAVERLALITSGGTDFQKSSAAAAVQSAAAALQAAQAKRDEAYYGPQHNTIDQARQAVRSAQLTVEAAQIRLKNAQIIAPFDGTVAAVNAKEGEFFSAASASGPAIVLLTPDALTFKMDVGETDYANLKVGQSGAVFFDSIPGQVYPFAITEIGLSPTVTQGVVTYQVKASLVVLPNAARPTPGMNARGQIVTQSKPDILVVPPRAIQRKGNDQVVNVKRDGSVSEQVVTTGVSDNDQIEVLSGLNEGDIVEVAALAGAKGAPTPKPAATLPGGVR